MSQLRAESTGSEALRVAVRRRRRTPAAHRPARERHAALRGGRTMLLAFVLVSSPDPSWAQPPTVRPQPASVTRGGGPLLRSGLEVVPGERLEEPPSSTPVDAVEERPFFRLPEENLTGRGLLDLTDNFPLATLHLNLPIDTLEVIEENSGTLRFAFHWANNFAEDDDFLVDAETYRLQLSGWYAVTSSFYLGGELGVQARDEGILDPVVDGFHDLTDSGDGGRTEFSTNAYRIAVTDGRGETHELDRGIGFEDFVLKSHWTVYRGNGWSPAVATQSFVSLPTSTEGFGSDGVDLGLNLSLFKTFCSRFHLYAVFGGTYFTDIEVEGLRYERYGYLVVGGAEFTVTENVSLLAQSMHYSALLESPSALNRGRNYVALGLKWEFVPKIELELSIVENLEPFRNSTDIAGYFAFSFGF